MNSANARKSIPFTEEETFEIQERLDTKLDASHLSYRPAAQGTVAYLEGWRSFNLANEVFGFNGWSSEILSFTIDFTDIDVNGKISLGMSCMVRVYLRDGTYHDDIGYGSADNQKSKSAAYEKAKKEAVTDGMKRALRMFGNRLGNCAYDKNFLKDIKNARPNSSSATPFRPANYPRVSKTPDTISNNNQITYNSLPPPQRQSTAQSTAQYSLIPAHHQQQHQPAVKSPATNFDDDSMFENSMMISEEDFIGSDDNFGNLTDAAVIELQDSYAANNGIYPLLPNKRK